MTLLEAVVVWAVPVTACCLNTPVTVTENEKIQSDGDTSVFYLVSEKVSDELPVPVSDRLGCCLFS